MAPVSASVTTPSLIFYSLLIVILICSLLLWTCLKFKPHSLCTNSVLLAWTCLIFQHHTPLNLGSLTQLRPTPVQLNLTITFDIVLHSSCQCRHPVLSLGSTASLLMLNSNIPVLQHSSNCHSMSQLAMGCVTCHTCHGCMMDFRPILGNPVEVTSLS